MPGWEEGSSYPCTLLLSILLRLRPRLCELGSLPSKASRTSIPQAGGGGSTDSPFNNLGSGYRFPQKHSTGQKCLFCREQESTPSLASPSGTTHHALFPSCLLFRRTGPGSFSTRPNVSISASSVTGRFGALAWSLVPPSPHPILWVLSRHL